MERGAAPRGAAPVLTGPLVPLGSLIGSARGGDLYPSRENDRVLEPIDDFGVEAGAGTPSKLLECCLGRERLAVCAWLRHRIEYVRRTDDAGFERDLLLFQLSRVAIPVPAFVVGFDDPGDAGVDGLERLQNVGALPRMLLDAAPLFTAQRRAAMQDMEEPIVDLPHVVEECGKAERRVPAAGDPVRFRDRVGEICDSARVTLRDCVPCTESIQQQINNSAMHPASFPLPPVGICAPAQSNDGSTAERAREHEKEV
jgi:hypothetical protein